MNTNETTTSTFDPSDLKAAAREMWARMITDLASTSNVMRWRGDNEGVLTAISMLTGLPLKAIHVAAAEVAMVRRIALLKEAAHYYSPWFQTTMDNLDSESHLGAVVDRFLANSWQTKPIEAYAYSDEEKDAIAQWIGKH